MTRLIRLSLVLPALALGAGTVPAGAETLGNPAPSPPAPMSSGRFDYKIERNRAGTAGSPGMAARPICTQARGASISTIPSVTAPGCGPRKGGALASQR
jgi:hypothetical protein